MTFLIKLSDFLRQHTKWQLVNRFWKTFLRQELHSEYYRFENWSFFNFWNNFLELLEKKYKCMLKEKFEVDTTIYRTFYNIICNFNFSFNLFCQDVLFLPNLQKIVSSRKFGGNFNSVEKKFFFEIHHSLIDQTRLQILLDYKQIW